MDSSSDLYFRFKDSENYGDLDDKGSNKHDDYADDIRDSHREHVTDHPKDRHLHAGQQNRPDGNKHSSHHEGDENHEMHSREQRGDSDTTHHVGNYEPYSRVEHSHEPQHRNDGEQRNDDDARRNHHHDHDCYGSECAHYYSESQSGEHGSAHGDGGHTDEIAEDSYDEGGEDRDDSQHDSRREHDRTVVDEYREDYEGEQSEGVEKREHRRAGPGSTGLA